MHCLPQHLAFKNTESAIDILSVKKKRKKKRKGKRNKVRKKTKKTYLDEFVNMAVPHLVRRDARDLLHFIRSDNLVRLRQGYFCVSSDVGTYFPFALVTSLVPLVTRANFLN